MNNTPIKSARLRRIATSKPAIVVLGLLVFYALFGFLLAPWLIRQQLPDLATQHLNAQASVSAISINPFLLTLEATDLAIAEKNGAPALNIARLFVDFEASSLLRRAWTFREITIDRPVITADLNAQDSLNLARLLAPTPAKPGAPASTQTQPPRFLLQHFAVTGGSISYTDHTVQPAAQAQFNPVNFEVHDVSTLPDRHGEHTLTARLLGGGGLQWQGKFTLAPLDSSGSITLKDAKLTTLWRFVQDHLTIAEPAGSYDLGLRYRVRSDRGALALQADDLSLSLKDINLTQRKSGAKLARLSTVVLADGSFDLQKRTVAFKDVRLGEGEISVTLDQDGTPDWATLFMPVPDQTPAATATPWQINLPKISIGPLALSVTDRSRVNPLQVTLAKTQAGFGAAVTTGSAPQVSIDNGTLSLGDVQLRSGNSNAPLITLTAAELTGATFDLQQKSMRARLLQLSGGTTLVERGADGKLNINQAFSALNPKRTPDLDYKFTIDRTEISGYAVALTDRTFEPALMYDLTDIQVKAEPLAYPGQGGFPVELTTQIKQGGKLQAKGIVDLLNQTADVRVNASTIALAPVAGLVGRHTTLTLATGKAGTEGRLRWNGKSNPTALTYTGTAAITDIELKTAGAGDRLVSWQRLAVTGLAFSQADNRLSIAELRLSQPYAKLIINKDRSTNFSGVMRSDKAASETTTTQSAASSPLAITMERVRLERGDMDFSDLSLVMPFATHIKALNGSANGLSFMPDSRASLKLEGRVGDFGLARAEGTFQIFAPKKFTDITVSFRNVALPLLNPYTVTFAGREIDSGKLSLDLQYKINNSNLAGENKMVLEQLVLGKRVKSPTALDLPLDLAIALLTDSDGKINLTVPVTGDLDNPRFDYGDIIGKAIGSTLASIITAPFRALAAIFGSNAETLGDIVFDPGSARILPTEYEKLRRVAEGLQKRPQLKLMVQGTYHSQSDGSALRDKLVRSELAVREGFKLATNEDPGPVGFSSAKTQRAIEDLLNEAGGNADAVAQFVASFRATAGGDIRRVNRLLAEMGGGAGDPALYKAMYDRLVEQKTLSSSALADLAQTRADAIITAFIKRLQFNTARLGSNPPAATTDVTDNGVPVKLSFAPIQ